MFRSGDLTVFGEPHSGWSQVLDDKDLKAAIEEDNIQTYGELAERFKIFEEMIRFQLHRMSGASEYPHTIGSQQVTMSDSVFLVVKQRTHLIECSAVTKKWVLYDTPNLSMPVIGAH